MDRAGAVERASGGALFFREVASPSPSGQGLLLRLIETREWRRLGSTAPHRSDALFVMSSSADLAERVESGGFREALYYRLLEGTTIHVPPLRARPADVAVIAEARASVLVRDGQGGLHDRWDGAGC